MSGRLRGASSAADPDGDRARPAGAAYRAAAAETGEDGKDGEHGKDGELKAVQAALAAEHAAVYGYGVVGGKIDGDRRAAARSAYDAHRARRDALVRAARDLGATPRAAAAGYALPFTVGDAAAAGRLAAELEHRVAGAYADLVRAASGARRRTAADALRDAAVRAVRWGGGSVAFPGLAERAAAASATGGPAGPAASRS